MNEILRPDRVTRCGLNSTALGFGLGRWRVAIQKPEWFKLNPAKFLTDAMVEAMSTLEIGACLRLLCRQWLDGHVPDDLHLLARLCRLDDHAMEGAWPTLSKFFPVMESGKRANRYLWIEREKVIADLERKSDEGTRAARKRWDARQQSNAIPTTSPDAEPDSCIARPSGSPMPEPMQDQTRADQSGERAIALAPPSDRAPATQRMRSVEMPERFEPSDHHRALAAELGISLEAAFAKFADHHASKGTKFVDWNKAFNNWLRREKDFARGSSNGRAGTPAPIGSAVENTLALLKDGEK